MYLNAYKDLCHSTPRDKDTEEVQPHNLVGGFDFVPALRSQGWPQVARDWIKRERKWPPPDVVDKIVQEGFHLVVKPPKHGGNPDCDFRISFSHPEYLLSQEMNDIQRELYHCLKRYHRAFLSIEPQGLVTFHLKNILQQTIEETGAEMWIESNRSECKKKNLPHFFVRSFNLFGAEYIESPIVLDSLARKVEQILKKSDKICKGFASAATTCNNRYKERTCFKHQAHSWCRNRTRTGNGTGFIQAEDGHGWPR